MHRQGIYDDAARAIQQAALRNFANYGYGGTSLRKIAADVHCDVALIPYYFGSKSELFRAVLTEANRPIREAMEAAHVEISDQGPGIECGRNLSRVLLQSLAANDGLLSVRALLLTTAAGDSVPSEVADFALSELQSFISAASGYVGSDDSVRLGIAKFVGLVLGSEVLIQFMDLEILSRLTRAELIELQVQALDEILAVAEISRAGS